MPLRKRLDNGVLDLVGILKLVDEQLVEALLELRPKGRL